MESLHTGIYTRDAARGEQTTGTYVFTPRPLLQSLVQAPAQVLAHLIHRRTWFASNRPRQSSSLGLRGGPRQSTLDPETIAVSPRRRACPSASRICCTFQL